MSMPEVEEVHLNTAILEKSLLKELTPENLRAYLIVSLRTLLQNAGRNDLEDITSSLHESIQIQGENINIDFQKILETGFKTRRDQWRELNEQLLNSARNALKEFQYMILRKTLSAKRALAEAEGLRVIDTNEVALVVAGKEMLVRFNPAKLSLWDKTVQDLYADLKTGVVDLTANSESTVTKLGDYLDKELVDKKKVTQEYVKKIMKKIQQLMEETEQKIRQLRFEVGNNYVSQKLLDIIAPVIDMLTTGFDRVKQAVSGTVDFLVPERILTLEKELESLEKEAYQIEEILEDFSEEDIRRMSLVTSEMKDPQEILDLVNQLKQEKETRRILEQGSGRIVEREILGDKVFSELTKTGLDKMLERLIDDVEELDVKQISVTTREEETKVDFHTEKQQKKYKILESNPDLRIYEKDPKDLKEKRIWDWFTEIFKGRGRDFHNTDFTV